MKRLLLIVLPLLLMVGCENGPIEISGPIETIPEVTGVQLEWIGYLYWASGREIDGVTYYQGTVWYTGVSVPNTLSSYPSYTRGYDNYGYSIYTPNEWYYINSVTEIELFQSQGYFNYKYMDGGVEVVQSNSLTNSHFWIEK